MKAIKIGVVGAGRGSSMMRYCLKNKDAVLTAICDCYRPLLEERKKEFGKKGKNIAYFTDYDEFLEKADIDAVVLANYANDHAPFAVKALKKGKHVLSEVLPCETLNEAVELVDAVEESGLVYDYSENYCYFGVSREMKRLYQKGVLGNFEYGEGEYVHNCEDCWADLTRADKNHWRNTKSAFFYCTHSAGPIIHSTGLRPVKVKGIEGKYSEKMKNLGAGGASIAVEMVTLENGGIFKSIHGGGLCSSSIWYSFYGTKAHLESAREPSRTVREAVGKVYIERKDDFRSYTVKNDRRSYCMGHGGSDWYTMNNFIRKINGQEADAIDVYEALDMYFVGYFGFLSAFDGGKEKEIPDFRDKSVREKYRGDTTCCTPKKAGKSVQPSNTQGGMDCPAEAYENMKKQLGRTKDKKTSLVTIVKNFLNRRKPL